MTELHKTYLERVGTGVAVAYSLPFGYISEAHVKLVVDTVEKTFTFPTTNQLLPDEAPPDGSKVIIQRVTPSEDPMVDFTIAGAITPANIDLGHQQALNVAQEAKDVVVLVLDSAEAIAASEIAAEQSVLDAAAFVEEAEDAVDAAEAVRDAALDARDAAATSASEAEGYKDTVLAFADPAGLTDGIAENTAAIGELQIAIAAKGKPKSVSSSDDIATGDILLAQSDAGAINLAAPTGGSDFYFKVVRDGANPVTINGLSEDHQLDINNTGVEVWRIAGVFYLHAFSINKLEVEA